MPNDPLPYRLESRKTRDLLLLRDGEIGRRTTPQEPEIMQYDPPRPRICEYQTGSRRNRKSFLN